MHVGWVRCVAKKENTKFAPERKRMFELRGGEKDELSGKKTWPLSVLCVWERARDVRSASQIWILGIDNRKIKPFTNVVSHMQTNHTAQAQTTTQFDWLHLLQILTHSFHTHSTQHTNWATAYQHKDIVFLVTVPSSRRIDGSLRVYDVMRSVIIGLDGRALTK